MNFNQNISDCTKAVSGWGQTTYHNICSGSKQIVEWGTMDYLGWSFLSLMFLLVAIVPILIASFIIKDMFFDRY